MQTHEAYLGTPSEDCLLLNVFVPPGVNFTAPTAVLPVMFFIHGQCLLFLARRSTHTDTHEEAT